MAKDGKITFSSEVLIWLRETAGYDLETVEEYGFKDIRDWESGEITPTYDELSWLATFYERPLAAFYFSKIPEDWKE